MQYPWGFRWRVDLIGWAFVLLFAVVLAPLHVILYYYEHKRRVTQVLPTLASTRPQP